MKYICNMKALASGFRQEDFLLFSLYKPMYNLNKLGRGLSTR